MKTKGKTATREEIAKMEENKGGKQQQERNTAKMYEHKGENNNKRGTLQTCMKT